MKRHLLILLILLSIILQLYADRYESVLVDTIYAEPNPMTGTIYYSMDYHDYYNFPNQTSLEIGYGYAQFVGTGIFELRSFISFETIPVPNDYVISSVMLRLKCQYYWDNGTDFIWPHYYSTPYSVNIDHIQFGALEPSVFDVESLTSSVGVLQDSAYVGWISFPITESYLNDIEQSHDYSQFRLRFPPGHDISLYEADVVNYSNNPTSSSSHDPHLIVTYHKSVSNSEEVTPMQEQIIKQIYPQPCINSFNIEFMEKSNKNISLSLYDLRGRLVYSENNLKSNKGLFRMQNLDYPSGIYFIKVKDGKRSQVKKITIIK